jgi:hypothetical protein
VERLQNNLTALNRALDTSATSRESPSTETDASHADSFSSRFRAFFQGLW